VERQIKELVLGSGQYAYIQDLTAGFVKVYTGPAVINQTAQDRPVIYEPRKGGWVAVDSIADSVRQSPIAVEGYYLTLFNPPQLDGTKPIQEAQPKDGVTGQKAPPLDIGKRVNIPGPVTFALWPGQLARHTRGHHLRSNQYLKVQVYNEVEASKQWNSGIVQSTSGEATELTKPKSLTVGTTLLVKGTDVSFYIPPTGIKVLERTSDDFIDGDANTDKYVRDALTLERLEYAILVDENGNKRYEKGPQVVFPEPTERFVSKAGNEGRPTRKFKALELTPIQGIHLKVIAPYKDGEREYKEGEEIFITGKDTSIYYPREEHSLISYDGQAKHFATAIPAGEARYVLNRMTGDIRMVKGPNMYLPDPRVEVFIRRVLSEEQCQLWYPGNTEALAYNQQLRAIQGKAPTTRAGVVSDGEYERATKGKAAPAGTRGGTSHPLESNLVASTSINYVAAAPFTMADSSVLGNNPKSLVADEFTRGSNYTDPRTLTLNTKYQGVPTINLWPGYAVTVCRPTGTGKENRRPVVGPATIHLEYDETLEVLELSTGKPKNTTKTLKTVYLKAHANKVSDTLSVETADHVQLTLGLSYEVNFEGDPNKWFNIENYVKYFTDRMRSVLKGAVHKISIAKFYANYTDIVRDIALGALNEEGGHDGFFFEENGMRIKDVDVLDVSILNSQVKTLLDDQQSRVIRSNIEIANAEGERTATEKLETLRREIATLRLDSTKQNIANQQAELLARHELELSRVNSATEQELKNQEHHKVTEATHDFQHAANLRREAISAEAEITRLSAKLKLQKDELEARTKATVDTYGAIAPGFAQTLISLDQNETAIKVAQALSAQALLGGGSLVETVTRMFGGTPLEGAVKAAINKLPITTSVNGTAKA